MLKWAMFLAKISKFLKEYYQLSLFLLSIFIIKVYPFYIFAIPSLAFSSHTWAKAGILIVFVLHIFENKKKFIKFINAHRKIFALLLLYLAGQSFSIFAASDTYLFLKFYHNVLINIAIFTLALKITTPHRYHIFFLFSLFTGAVLVVFETLFRLFMGTLVPFFVAFFQKEVVDTMLSNIKQGKYVLALSSEIFLPFLLLGIALEKRKIAKILIVICVLALIFLSIISNFRTRFVCLLFALLFSVVVFYAQKFNSKVKNRLIVTSSFGFISTLIIAASFFAISASNTFFSYNVIDRFLLQDQTLDVGTIDTRTKQWDIGLDLFKASPLIGIGLGNFSYYMDTSVPKTLQLADYERSFFSLSLSRPHNIFLQHLAETGIMGLITFSTLLFYFLLKDIKRLRIKKNYGNFAFIISSWTVLAYALFNPADTVYVMGWFWFVRGIVERS